MRYGMVIDLDKCIGCQTCMVVCKMHNSLPPGAWWNRAFTQGVEVHQTALPQENGYRMDYLPVSCQMCDNPACQSVCPTGATYTNEDGVVLVDYSRCIGCRYCMAACPYGVRQFNWEDPAKAKADFGYAYGHPYDEREGKKNRLVYTRDRPMSVVEKCTFCAQYIDEGETACTRACPGKARFFGDLDDPNSAASQALAGKRAYRLMEKLGTEPKVYYLSSHKTGI